MNKELKKYILDSYALLAYLNNEPGMQQVQALMKDAEEKKYCVLLSSITLAEVLNITERELGLVKAQAVQAVIEQLPIQIVPCTEDTVLEAAHLRAHASISQPGAFAAVLAMQSGGILCTGDPEYQPLQERIKIEWLRTAQTGSDSERKRMKEQFTIRDVESDNDFEDMAVLFTIEEDFTATAKGLKDEVAKKKDDVYFKIAVDSRKDFMGFYWIEKSRIEPGRAYIYLIVKPDQRRKGVGTLLMRDIMEYVQREKFTKLRLTVRDNAPECIRFAQLHGFAEIKHQISMDLDLDTFDFQTYDAAIDHLKTEGFLFTNMAEQGDTPEAQRKLYELNESTNMDTMGSDGSRAWKDFEDFQKSVCQAKWYRPEGQKVVIDTKTGKWVAMCAIGLFDGQGYNLHTGVDRAYRGRKLGQAVKATGLRYAKDVLKVNKIFTHHNTKNEPMLAIDRKLGYQQISGTYTMQKTLGKKA